MFRRSRSGERFAVVDVETTGLYNSDRIVEVAVVTIDRSGAVVDEWDTLIDPRRDVGPTHIHRITPSMVAAAPTFEEISVALARRLDGAVLVAHNLPFDVRMLTNEFRRVGGRLDPGAGFCTYRATGVNLAAACRRHGIPLENAHRALVDVRATARLLGAVADPDRLHGVAPATAVPPEVPFSPRTLRRDDPGAAGPPAPAPAGTGGTFLPVRGTRVCFTGTALTPDGAILTRDDLDALAAGWGLVPVAGVTKRGCDLLVAADPSSQSNKARKARSYGIPIVGVRDFLAAGPGAAVPTAT